jgi:hypothetical protein
MLGFCIKKTFFDIWDNLFLLLILNLGFILMTGVVVYLPSLLDFSTFWSIFGICLGVLLFTLYLGGAAAMTKEMSDFQSVSIVSLPRCIMDNLIPSLVIGGIAIVQVVIISVVFPFYMNIGGLVGLGVASLIFWSSLIWWIASQYYWPLYCRLEGNAKKALKKSVLLFFDNTGFSIFLGVGSIFLLVVSAFTAFLIPGFAAILLWHQVGFKLRLYKYDYLEENPGADRKRIPWAVMVQEDREKIGPRSLKGMIFPWKE